MNSLDRAIDLLGGPSELASRIGAKPNVVGNWRTRAQVPAEQVLAVERATDGRVTRYELRPDVFGPTPADADPEPREVANG